MKRKDLEALELSKEVIDTIMELNGKDINPLKEQMGSLQEQLDNANTTITDLKSKAGNVDEVQKIADKYKADYDALVKSNQKKDFDAKVDKYLTDLKAKDLISVKAHLNFENIKLEDDKLVGIEEQVKSLQEKNGYLFEPQQSNNTGNGFRTGFNVSGNNANKEPNAYLADKYKNNPYFKG